MIEAFPVQHKSERGKYDILIQHDMGNAQLGILANSMDEAISLFENEIAIYVPAIEQALHAGLNSRFTHRYMLLLGVPKEIVQCIVPYQSE